MHAHAAGGSSAAQPLASAHSSERCVRACRWHGWRAIGIRSWWCACASSCSGAPCGTLRVALCDVCVSCFQSSVAQRLASVHGASSVPAAAARAVFGMQCAAVEMCSVLGQPSALVLSRTCAYARMTGQVQGMFEGTQVHTQLV